MVIILHALYIILSLTHELVLLYLLSLSLPWYILSWWYHTPWKRCKLMLFVGMIPGQSEAQNQIFLAFPFRNLSPVLKESRVVQGNSRNNGGFHFLTSSIHRIGRICILCVDFGSTCGNAYLGLYQRFPCIKSIYKDGHCVTKVFLRKNDNLSAQALEEFLQVALPCYHTPM